MCVNSCLIGAEYPSKILEIIGRREELERLGPVRGSTYAGDCHGVGPPLKGLGGRSGPSVVVQFPSESRNP